MKKRFLAVLLMLIYIASATACGPGGETVPDESESRNDVITAKVIDVDLTSEKYAFGVDKNQPELLVQVNALVTRIMGDGTLDEICNKYFGDGNPEAVTSAEPDPSKDQLVVATNAAFEPFEYTQGDNYYGIDMEIAAMLADDLGLELVIQNMDFDLICPAVGRHECDIAMTALTINEEREEYVIFSKPYYEASQRLIVPSTDTTFDGCTDAAEVEELLGELNPADKIGVEGGTTGQFYVEGDADWGFDGLPAACVPYRNGSLAIQDMLNGNVKYVIIDAAPAAAITELINALQ